MANLKIKRYRPHGGVRLYGNQYRPIQLTYQILDGLYERTILKSIIQPESADTCQPVSSKCHQRSAYP